MNKKFLDLYIHSLTKEVDENKISNEYDLIFDGGAFNGLMGQGVGLYIKSLMKTYNFKIVRVSGCSIGAFLATMFISDISYDLEESFLQMIHSFKKTLLLKEYHSLLKKYIFSIFKSDDLHHLTDKLYITYWDMKKRKQIVIHKYKNRKHLLKVLIRSSHIPYISTNELKYKGRYVDGISPYIFREKERPALFVSLMTYKLYSRALNIKGEYSAGPRILYGIMDANDFFSKGRSDMCSFIGNWNIVSKLSLRMREFFLCMIISWLEIFQTIKNKLPHWIMDSIITKGPINVCKQVYVDIIDHMIH